MKVGDFFPNRYTLIAKNGDRKEVSKSRSLEYILSKKDEYKQKYAPGDVEFIIKRSEVKKCRKPLEYFSNLPEWDIEHWGINSSGEYYVADKELNKIKRLR